MNQTMFNTLLLAGLLKGIFDLSMKGLFSAVEGVDRELAEDLILERGDTHLHHILRQAGAYAGMRTHGPKDEVSPLASVFSTLDLGKPKAAMRYHSLSHFTLEAAFPVEKTQVDREGIHRLKQGLLEELHHLEKQGPWNFEAFYTRLLLLLQKYAWCIPGDSPGEKVDVSLFDQSKATCAIGACLFRYFAHRGDWSPDAMDDGSLKFRLLVGDLSGIQNYIFDISKTGVGGVAKRLRARSFYLGIISEAISHKILHQFDLPLSNIVMASGGNFYILLQNTQDAVKAIDVIQKDLDEWCLREFRGELSVNLASIEFCGEDFQNFHQVLGRLALELSQKKSRPLYDGLVQEGVWREEAFRRPWADTEGLGLCSGCGKHMATALVEDAPLCRHCEDDLTLGRLLPKARYIVFARGSMPKRGLYQLFEDYSFGVFPQVPRDLGGTYLVSKINDLDLPDEGGYPVNFKYVANFVPTAGEDLVSKAGNPRLSRGTALDFDQIAALSTGRPWLGYYKADVDNLGSIFAFGLTDPSGENPNNISRIATLSRMMDTFFSGWVVETVRQKFPHGYIVYSGGDDLLIIGPWSDVLDMSLWIKREFERFTAYNPNITLSAGISFSRPKIPVSAAVEQAEQNLESSKERLPLTGEGESRNQLTAFGETVKWHRVPYLLENAKQLTQWLDGNKVSVNFARNLQDYHEMFKTYLEDQWSEGLKYLPLLSYDIARNLPSPNDRDEEKRRIRGWAEELKDINSDKMRFLGFIVNYALNARR